MDGLGVQGFRFRGSRIWDPRAIIRGGFEFSGLSVCVCVCVCVRARGGVSERVCAKERKMGVSE